MIAIASQPSKGPIGPQKHLLCQVLGLNRAVRPAGAVQQTPKVAIDFVVVLLYQHLKANR
jgi:hypothetical protein